MMKQTSKQTFDPPQEVAPGVFLVSRTTRRQITWEDWVFWIVSGGSVALIAGLVLLASLEWLGHGLLP